MPPPPLDRSLNASGRPSPDRTMVEPRFQVVRQFAGTQVTSVRLLLQALQADRFQVARHPARSRPIAVGGFSRTCTRICTGVSPSNGGRPVSIS